MSRGIASSVTLTKFLETPGSEQGKWKGGRLKRESMGGLDTTYDAKDEDELLKYCKNANSWGTGLVLGWDKRRQCSGWDPWSEPRDSLV